MHPTIFAAIAVGVILAWTVTFTELYRLTGSVWPAVVMHAMEDAFVNTLVWDEHARIVEERKLLVSPIVGGRARRQAMWRSGCGCGACGSGVRPGAPELHGAPGVHARRFMSSPGRRGWDSNPRWL